VSDKSFSFTTYLSVKLFFDMQETFTPHYNYKELDDFLASSSNPSECWRVLDEMLLILVSYHGQEEGYLDDLFPLYWPLRQLRDILGGLEKA